MPTRSTPVRPIQSLARLGLLIAIAGLGVWPALSPAHAPAVAGVGSPAPAPQAQAMLAPQGRRGGAPASGVYRSQVTANWFDGNTKFWYMNALRDGAKEFVLVDAVKGKRALAFDHAKLAAGLSKASDESTSAGKLPFSDIAFVDKNAAVAFTAYGKTWKCDLATYAVTSSTSPTQVSIRVPAPNHLETALDIARVESVWGGGAIPDTDPLARSRQELMTSPYWEGDIQTGFDHPDLGVLRDTSDKSDESYPSDLSEASDDMLAPQARGGGAAGGGAARGGRGGRGGRAGAGRGGAGAAARGGAGGGRGFGGRGGGNPIEASPLNSPDEKWGAYLSGNNVFVKPITMVTDLPGGDKSFTYGSARQLSTDGETSNSYGRLAWAPDSKGLVGWRVEPGVYNPVWLVFSSPYGPPDRPDISTGPATLEERDYVQAGNKGTMLELHIFDVANGKNIKPAIDRIDASYGQPAPRWNADKFHFTIQFEDRGHERFRIVDVDAHAGTTRTILDDKADAKHKFIWIQSLGNGVPSVTYLDADPKKKGSKDEILYAGEFDGWRHFWMIDAKTGAKKCITPGEWPLRDLVYVDTEKRQIWFDAGGVIKGQDPYLRQFGRVNFDGSGLTWLTDGNGDHAVAWSPDFKYFVDSYSRVDLPPVTELRNATTGKLVCKLEEADISQLKEEGTYHPSEVFSAKGRDGTTDIWGFITRPVNFDKNKKYPVIENIYAGPHGFFVPKTWSAAPRTKNLTDLGFIVVQIDGMGTTGRSKAFHDVAWKNLKDAGFPDRIAWMKAAAAKYPEMDLDKVGIYGTSAGGQESTAALLFFPEFYKVAVSNSGCHDNRIDKQDWNEHWMGYRPDVWSTSPDNWYSASSNIDNAWRLQGHLSLVVAGDDHNVPPESTLRLSNALIASQKDFDLLFVPRSDHGAASPITTRRLQDYFVKYLLGQDAPNRNPDTAKAPPTGGGGRRGRAGGAAGGRRGGGTGVVGGTRGAGSATRGGTSSAPAVD